MSWVNLLVVLVALLGLVLLGLGGFLTLRGQRRRLGGVLAVAGLVVLLAEETLPRVLLPDPVEVGCAHSLPLHPRLAGGPLAWQAVTGGVTLDARIDAEALEDLITDATEDTPLAEADVETNEDGMEVLGEVDTPLGGLPVTVQVVPVVAHGQLEVESTGARVAGIEVPDAVVDAADRVVRLLADTGSTSSGCGSSPVEFTYTDVRTDVDGVTVRVRL